VKRLFIAVDVDESVRIEVGRISSALRNRFDPALKTSWVQPDRMHLTLHFFAQADDMEEQRIRAALTEPIRQHPFNLSFTGLGVFPSRGSPRVLWLGIGDGLDALHRVQQALDQRLGRIGPRNEPFKPHLTLCRFRAGRVRVPPDLAVGASAGPCLIDRVTLYESRLSPAGPTYLPVAQAPLYL
jgi:RNA 2',3'-cyclic 3'-phosphodiesterase